MAMTQDDIKKAAEAIQALLTAGKTGDAVGALTGLRNRLKAEVEEGATELIPNLEKAEKSLETLATRPRPRPQRSRTELTIATDDFPMAELSMTESTLVSVGNVYGTLSAIGGLAAAIIALIQLSNGQLAIKIVVAALGLNAIVFGIYASCMASLVATISGRLRRLGG